MKFCNEISISLFNFEITSTINNARVQLWSFITHYKTSLLCKHQHTQSCSRVCAGWAGTRKKRSPTRTYPDHQTSFINFLHLVQSISILLVQFTYLTCPLPQPLSMSSLVHFLVWNHLLHTSPSHFFSQHKPVVPYHRDLFCCTTEIMSPIPNLSVSVQYLEICLLP